VLAAFLAACASSPSTTVVNARPMDVTEVAQGDCAEAVRRAIAEPDLEVDSLPRPVRQWQRPFPNMPWRVKQDIDAKGSTVKVDVVVDTLGRPVMSTFTVVEASHPWLVESFRKSLPSWRFRAARLSGCKVPRIWKFSATSRPRS
jgi:hypothetical protein